MVKACPHCKTPLQPGEVYVGWCGECGNSFFQMPDSSAALGSSEQRGRSVAIPTDWLWVARGLLLKLVALVVGAGTCLAAVMAAGWNLNRAFNAPFPIIVGLLLAAVVIDIVGRLLCLGTPQASIRWLVVASVICQLSAIPWVVAVAIAPTGAVGNEALLTIAALSQTAAAILFTFYLSAVGVYFRNPLVMTLARLIKRFAIGGVVVVTIMAVVIVFLTGVLVVIATLSMFCCPIVGWAVMPDLKKDYIGDPARVAITVVLGLVELAYGATLTSVLVELWRRKMLAR